MYSASAVNVELDYITEYGIFEYVQYNIPLASSWSVYHVHLLYLNRTSSIIYRNYSRIRQNNMQFDAVY